MREAWTDERLDDLKAGMHREFDGVQRRFDQVHREIDQVRAEVRDFRAHTDAGFAAVDARFDGLNRNLFLGMVSIVATLLAAIFARGLL